MITGNLFHVTLIHKSGFTKEFDCVDYVFTEPFDNPSIQYSAYRNRNSRTIKVEPLDDTEEIVITPLIEIEELEPNCICLKGETVWRNFTSYATFP